MYELNSYISEFAKTLPIFTKIQTKSEVSPKKILKMSSLWLCRKNIIIKSRRYFHKKKCIYLHTYKIN